MPPAGIRVVLLSGMKKPAGYRRSHRLLRWVFRKGNQLLTCQLDWGGHRAAYSLSLVPHWDTRKSEVGSMKSERSDFRKVVVETFDAGVAAFHRHASVAAQLRSQGWTLASYTVDR